MIDWRPNKNQNFGIFSEDKDPITTALQSVDFKARTHVGRFTLLNLAKDPQIKFKNTPIEGAHKKIYYCISCPLGNGEFNVHVAARSKEKNCPFFEREIKVLTLLKGVKGALQPLDIVPAGDFEYLISELANCGDLFTFIVDPERILDGFESHWIAYLLVCAVQACHSKGIVLRDLKPENVLVHRHQDRSLELSVIDFGLAYILAEDSPEESTKDRGSPAYMSPEEWDEYERTGKTLPASFQRDLWALGAILFTLSTKKYAAEDEVIEVTKVSDEIIVIAPEQKIKVTHLKEYKPYLGIYDREIRGILFSDRDERPSLAEIRKRMEELLAHFHSDKKEVSALRSADQIAIPINQESLAEPLLTPNAPPERAFNNIQMIWDLFCRCFCRRTAALL